jgi:hypothetical protein
VSRSALVVREIEVGPSRVRHASPHRLIGMSTVHHELGAWLRLFDLRHYHSMLCDEKSPVLLPEEFLRRTMLDSNGQDIPLFTASLTGRCVTPVGKA